MADYTNIARPKAESKEEFVKAWLDYADTAWRLALQTQDEEKRRLIKSTIQTMEQAVLDIADEVYGTEE